MSGAVFGLTNQLAGPDRVTPTLSKPKLCLDGRRLLQRCLELSDVEVGDYEIAEHKGRSFGLATELYHLVHEDFVATYFACFQANTVCAEVAERFVAPWAAIFDIKDRCIHSV